LTRPVVDTSEQFLALLGQGKIAEAYAAAGDGFRAQHDDASFNRAVNQLGLTEYASVSWHNRQIENREATAEGTVTTKSGAPKPVAIRLIQQGSKWTVVGVRYGGVELETIKALPPMPPETKLELMIAEALLRFNQAVQAGDFAAFYDQLADVWKKQRLGPPLPQGLGGGGAVNSSCSSAYRLTAGSVVIVLLPEDKQETP
jgi:hypothetical protein